MTSNESEIKVGLLIVSDSVSTGTRRDGVRDALQEAINSLSPQFHLVRTHSTRDESAEIVQRVGEMVRLDLDVLITSGGTGMGLRDVTPDALAPVIHRRMPALETALTMHSIKHTPLAMLARPIAGIWPGSRTLVVALPGSPRAVAQLFPVIAPVLPHLKSLISDASDAIRSDHDALGVHESTLDPAVDPTPPAKRQRMPPSTVYSLEDALELVANNLHTLPVETLSVTDSNLHGAIVAVEVQAPTPLPRFAASSKDGYLVWRSAATRGATLRVIGALTATCESIASQRPPQNLPKDACYRIATGARVPFERLDDGNDAMIVVMVEHTAVAAVTPDGREESAITLTASLPPVSSMETNIREVGSDIRENSVVLNMKTRIDARLGHAGALASVGVTNVMVYRRPRVAVFSTGDELVSADSAEPAPSAVFDGNRPALVALYRECVNKQDAIIDGGILRDNPRSMRDALKRRAQDCDVLVLSGGVSMGERDVVKHVLRNDLNAEIHCERVAMRPGRPFVFATVSRRDSSRLYIFALPGNPLSALVTSHVFVLPALRRLMGEPLELVAADTHGPFAHRRILAEWASDEPTERPRAPKAPNVQWVPVMLYWTLDGPRVSPCHLNYPASSDAVGLNDSNALALVEPGPPGAEGLIPDKVRCLVFGPSLFE